MYAVSGGADHEFAGAREFAGTREFAGEIPDFRDLAPANSRVKRTFSPIYRKRSLSALSK